MDGKSDNGRELSSWKEIADFLGITVRTAQKWEAERGLPVRRLPGVKGRLRADRDELISWKEKTYQKPDSENGAISLRRYIIYSVALLATCICIGLAIWLVWKANRQPESGRVEGDFLIVSDTNGEEMWRKSFGVALAADAYTPPDVLRTPKIRCEDIDEDGDKEVLFSLWGAIGNQGPYELICLSKDKGEKWRYKCNKTIITGAGTYAPPFQIQRFGLVQAGPEKKWCVVVSSRHMDDCQNQVALFSSQGDMIREYWHSGGLDQLAIGDLNHDGRSEIYLGGVNNQRKQATLVVLDPETMDGASIEDDPAYQIRGYVPGREIARIFFPRSCINRKSHEYNRIGELAIVEDSIKVHVIEYDLTLADGIYRLDRDFNVLNYQWCDGLREVHMRLFAEHKLDHAYSKAEEVEMERIRVIRGSPPR
jgi:hypothetical protein